MSDTPRFATIARRVDQMRLERLPVPTLRDMRERNARERAAALAHAQDLEAQIQAAADIGDAEQLERVRHEFVSLRRRHDELEEEAQRLEVAYQEGVVHEGMARTLGGMRRAQALRILVLLLIVVVLGILGVELVFPHQLSARTQWVLWCIDFAACGIFFVEFVMRYRCAESKRWFLRRHWIDLVSSVPVPPGHLALGALTVGGGADLIVSFTRTLRLARLVRVLRVLRAFRLVMFLWRGMDQLFDVLNVRLMKRSLMFGVLLLVLGAGLIFVTEGPYSQAGLGNPDVPIGSVPEAAWWSFTTAVTGGFADLYNPQSLAGRAVTAVLVVAGMIIVGVFTATLTAVLVGDEAEELEVRQRQLLLAVEELKERLDRLAPPGGQQGPSDSPSARGN